MKIRPRHLLALSLATGPALAADPFDLDALIQAARQEGPITVYAPSGKIVETAQQFSQRYGVQAAGLKINGAAQMEKLLREYRAGNIQGDVVLTGDPTAAVAQLIPLGVVTSWLPPDLAGQIPPQAQNPLLVYGDPTVWTYNTQVYAHCPIDNVWALTEPTWQRRVTLQDPLTKAAYLDWFNQLEQHHDGEMAAAYQAYYGKPFDASQGSATQAWVTALAKNAPLPTDSDGAASEAVGAPGQAAPFMGLISTAKYRDVASGKLHLGICAGIRPFVGISTPAYGLIATKTKSPNTARLLLHYLMTEEGIRNQTVDGKISGNASVPPHPQEASGIHPLLPQLLQYQADSALADFDSRQRWADLWQLNFRR
ncbi:ABC transporter substrate-binding protein [Pseudaeromonas paramecii]|uniref:ABC transporter substrate-binding protein n=1 Tax=Pseudaeromonas paramecii TaxID=2138166 RepID=A0ABP8PZ66_9GAMM